MDKEKKTLNVDPEDIKLASKAAPEDLKESEPVNIGNEILDWVESFIFAMFIIILIFIFFLRIVTVEGDSMNTTLTDGDRLIMTHMNYKPERDDIIVVNSEILNKTIIKNKVRIDYNKNKVYVNDEEQSNEHISVTMIDKGGFNADARIADGIYEYNVPEGKVFVMGDNRNNSTDSRMLGFIDNDDILGHAVFRLYPLKSFGKIS